MLHAALWNAIDKLAEQNHMTCSALARLSGLDSTVFNKCKRTSPHGQPRWISTETIAKILVTTNTSVQQFAKLFPKKIEQ
ncbi:MAG: helix-turn-helix domain-containing protein [Alphaproteobacteria bacterium]